MVECNKKEDAKAAARKPSGKGMEALIRDRLFEKLAERVLAETIARVGPQASEKQKSETAGQILDEVLMRLLPTRDEIRKQDDDSRRNDEKRREQLRPLLEAEKKKLDGLFTPRSIQDSWRELSQKLESIEKEALVRRLAELQWDIDRLASELDTTPDRLIKKMKDYGIPIDRN